MNANTSLNIFFGILLVNVICWGIVLLRILQNLDTGAAKVVLGLHLLGVAPGFFAAFIYGWVRRDLHLRAVMPFWSFSFALLIVWGYLMD